MAPAKPSATTLAASDLAGVMWQFPPEMGRKGAASTGLPNEGRFARLRYIYAATPTGSPKPAFGTASGAS
ncbi:hypothetical protein Abr02nite_51190 [Paractinoplanes brasiliensis]|nr:hypothetical protein Abr02nite_51190 [Actinoplanes brasiliensis]